MALFSRNKDQKDSSETKPANKKAGKELKKPSAKSTEYNLDRDLQGVILKPRITEKAVGHSEKNVYTFVVHKNATKYDVRDAVKELFDVTPVKVNIVNKSPRSYMARSKGRTVSEKGMKKAYVYLKQGDTINIM